MAQQFKYVGMSNMVLFPDVQYKQQGESSMPPPPPQNDTAAKPHQDGTVTEPLESIAEVRTRAEAMHTTVRRLDQLEERSGHKKLEEASDTRRKIAKKESVVEDEYGAWVLVIRRRFTIINNEETYQDSHLDVKSPLLKSLLKEVLSDDAMELETVTIPWPAERLFHFWHDITAAAAARGDELTQQHAKVLTDLIEDEYSSTIKMLENYLPMQVIDFETLWALFKPGTLIATRVDGHDRALRLVRSWYASDDSSSGESLHLQAKYVDSDGRRLGETSATVRVPHFTATRAIASLPVHPLECNADAEALRERLIVRGRKFAALRGQCYRFYEGFARDCKKQAEALSHRLVVSSRVMIDIETCDRINATTAVSIGDLVYGKEAVTEGKPVERSRRPTRRMQKTDALDIELFEDEEAEQHLMDEHYMICTHEIKGWSFTDKDFLMLSIDCISEIQFDEDAFKNLVLPENQKELIRVLVDNHTSQTSTFDDFITGKGRGLISVLHGPAGTGKTMTAESVAEHTRRPLYTCTSGELGCKADELEKNLSKILDLCKTWNAIVLLDEADVFLEARSSRNVTRNTLVSVFLRVLEYSGVMLFLTTNRVKCFDQAFHSRIHISLRYHALSVDVRRAIWHNFVATLPADSVHVSEADFDELARPQLNGREIKNMMKTGQALARSQGRPLVIEHLRIVLGVMATFDFEDTLADGGETEAGTDVKKLQTADTLSERSDDFEMFEP